MSATLTMPPVTSSTPARRSWLLLLPVFLGLALYLVNYVIRYAPDKVPTRMMMPAFMAAMWGPMAAVVLLGLLWLIIGPARFLMRLGLVLLVAAVGAGLMFSADATGDGFTRFWLFAWGLPGAVGVLTVTLVALSRAPAGVCYSAAVLLAAAAVIPWELVRIEGVTGNFGLNPVWRWTPTAIQNVAEFTRNEEMPAKGALSAVAAVTEGDWPGFRGAKRDGRAPVPL